MAKQDEEIQALTLHAERQNNQLEQAKKTVTELKRGQNPLGMIGMGGVGAITGAAIGLAEGYHTAGNAEKEEAIRGIGPAVAVVVGGVAAVAAGPGKLRAAGAGVASAGATLLARDIAKGEGIKLKLEAMKAAGQQAAGGQQIAGVKRA